MAVEMPGFKKTFEAGADLTAAQFKFVKLDGTVGPTGCPRVVVCAADTDLPAGVLQNDPKVVGEGADVMITGETKVQADAALATVGVLIGTSADGQADAKSAGTASYIVGYVSKTASGANVLASAIINCINPAKLGD